TTSCLVFPGYAVAMGFPSNVIVSELVGRPVAGSPAHPLTLIDVSTRSRDPSTPPVGTVAWDGKKAWGGLTSDGHRADVRSSSSTDVHKSEIRSPVCARGMATNCHGPGWTQQASDTRQ